MLRLFDFQINIHLPKGGGMSSSGKSYNIRFININSFSFFMIPKVTDGEKKGGLIYT